MAQYRRDARRGPQIERALVVEQVAIAKAGAVGEAASGRERPELRIEPFAAEDEDAPSLRRSASRARSRPACTARRCGSSPRGAADRPRRGWQAPARTRGTRRPATSAASSPITERCGSRAPLCHVTPAFRSTGSQAPRSASESAVDDVSRWAVACYQIRIGRDLDARVEACPDVNRLTISAQRDRGRTRRQRDYGVSFERFLWHPLSAVSSHLFSSSLRWRPRRSSRSPRRSPTDPGSLKFAAIGDNGTGDRAQYEMAQQMTKVHATFPFDLVIMLGDNMYGGQSPADYVKKFEQPYAPLLAAGVKFQASLGNHDRPEQVNYKPFNMNGQRYYTYRAQQRPVLRARQHPDGSEAARLDRCDAERRARGLEDLLLPSPAVLECRPPRIVGRPARPARADLRQARRQRRVFGPRPRLRALKPQKGIYYFVSGSAGQLRKGNMDASDQTAASFDQDLSFMVVEVAGIGHVLSGDLAHRPDRRLRRDPPAAEAWRNDAAAGTGECRRRRPGRLSAGGDARPPMNDDSLPRSAAGDHRDGPQCRSGRPAG